MNNKEIIIIGASGHAKVVASVAEELGFEIKGYYDDNPTLVNKTFLSKPILGTIDNLAANQYHQTAIIAIGNNRVRANVANKLKEINWITLIHPKAYVHKTAQIGKGSVVFAGCVIQTDVIVEEHCIINTGSTVDHDCIIKSFSHIAPGSNLAGGVLVEEGVLLGIGSKVIPRIQIGKNATVGAGGVVINNISENSIVVGCPAKSRE